MRTPFRAASRWLSGYRDPSQAWPLGALRLPQRGGSAPPIDVHPEVQEALASHKPVVGLETAITTHGLPFPSNRDTAFSLERIVRSAGAVPATIALVRGRVKIGLGAADIERLADPANASAVVKVSRRDIAPAVAAKKDGGTTVSATMIFAALAGIDVVATGGLGGVHRGGENSLDISADLPELSRCSVALVSAGVKSILDIGRTLEYLETLGVPVVTISKTDDFPAFYYSRSGFKSPWRVDDPKGAAEILFMQRQFGLTNGVFFPVPIPEEYDDLGEALKIQVDQAIAESEANGVNQMGQKATPWLLKRIAELSSGNSIKCNIALIEHTASVGGQIAVELANMSRSLHSSGNITHGCHSRTNASPRRPLTSTLTSAKVLVFGSAAVDITAKVMKLPGEVDLVHSSSTSPGLISLTMGGVGRNMAEACHRCVTSRFPDLLSATMLVSMIGNDHFGQLITQDLQRLGMRTDGLFKNAQHPSAACNMVMDSAGNLVGGVAEMSIIQSLDSNMAIQQIKEHQPVLVAFDGNLSINTLKAIVRYCYDHNIHTFFEPTSVPKSTSILSAIEAFLKDAEHPTITFTSPNVLELVQVYHAAQKISTSNAWWTAIDSFLQTAQFNADLERLKNHRMGDSWPSKNSLAILVEKGVMQMALKLLSIFQNIILKCGSLGVITVLRIPSNAARNSGWVEWNNDQHIIGTVEPAKDIIILQYSPALALGPENIINCTGAGDSLAGSILASLLERPQTFQDPCLMDKAIYYAQHAAVLSLQSSYAISPKLSSREYV